MAPLKTNYKGQRGNTTTLARISICSAIQLPTHATGRTAQTRTTSKGNLQQLWDAMQDYWYWLLSLAGIQTCIPSHHVALQAVTALMPTQTANPWWTREDDVNWYVAMQQNNLAKGKMLMYNLYAVATRWWMCWPKCDLLERYLLHQSCAFRRSLWHGYVSQNLQSLNR